MSTPLSPILSAREHRRKQYEVVDKFFNKMQRQAMAINAHDEYIVASRGTGKSEGIDARIILRNEMCIRDSYAPSVLWQWKPKTTMSLELLSAWTESNPKSANQMDVQGNHCLAS